jgi:replicative DNA helicase Mcm
MSDMSVSQDQDVTILVEYKDVVKDFFENFLDENNRPKYKERISEALRRGKTSVTIDYMDLYSYNEELAKRLLEEPLKVLREVIEPALNEYILSEYGVETKIRARVKSLPITYKIRDLRNEHIGKLIQIEGIVVRMTPLKQRLARAMIYHSECQGKFPVEVEGEYFEIPKICPLCNSSKGSFEIIEEESQYVDYQKIVISEMPEELPPGQMPRQITAILEEDLVDIARPGDRVIVTGVLRLSKDRSSRRRTIRSVYEAELYVLNIELSHKGVEQVELSERDIEEIKRLAKDPLIRRKIIASIAPTIYGLWDIKEAIALLLFGGVPKIREDGTRVRGDIHVLIIGDPGTAKSQLLQFTAKVAPRGIFTTGRGSTAAGLCIGPESLVYTNYGILNPETLFTINNQRTVLTDNIIFTLDSFLSLYSYTEKGFILEEVSHIYLLPVETAVRIETFTGKDLVVSPETKILVYEKDKIVWKKAIDLREGEHIIIVRKIPEPKNKIMSIFNLLPPDLKIVDDEGKIYKVQDIIKMFSSGEISLEILRKKFKYILYEEERFRKFYNLPDLGEEFIEFYSILFTKGVIEDLKSSHQIRIINGGKDLLIILRELLKKLFNIDEDMIFSHDDRDIIIKDPMIFRLASHIGASKKYVERTLDPNIHLLSNNLLKIFLKKIFTELGFRDVVGRVYVKHYSLLLLRQLSLLLKRFGVLSVITRDPDDDSFYLIISDRASLDMLEREIGIPDKVENNYQGSAYTDLIIDIDDKLSITKIKEVWLEKGGVMYDFTISNTENFLVEDYIVHNTASVLRDRSTGEYYLEAGALVLGDLGVVCIDEIDKMREEDRVAIHEALEQQTVSISKAGIHAVLNARASVLAAGNPKYGRYEEDRHFIDNINLPPTILSRFDLIFVLRDKPSPDEDRRLASYIVEAHSRYEELKPLIEPDLLRKYIAYARTHVKPVLKEEARKMLVDFFVEMRSAVAESKGIVPLPITARQMEALIRMAEAHARMALKDVVDEEDASEAIRMMLLMLSQVGIDVETKAIDIDAIMTGKPTSKRRKIHEIEDVIRQITKLEGKPCAPLSEIISRLQDRNIPQEEIERLLNTLYREGLVTQIKIHCYKLVE